MSVNDESKPSATPPSPIQCEWGGVEFYTSNRFARSSPVFNNCLNTFVPDCLRSYILEAA